MNEIIIITLCSIIIIVTIISVFLYVKYSKLAKQKKEEYQHWQEDINYLKNTKIEIEKRIEIGKSTLSDIHHKVDFADQNLKDLNRQYDITKDHLNNIEEVANNNKIKLEEECNKIIQEYQDELQRIKESCEAEAAIVQNDLESLKKTRHVTIEQWRKQEQEQAQLDGYKLNITVQDKKDIQLLKNIQLQFSHPRVISKLIWQTYFQPLAKQQFVMILGNTTKCGIYKITNIINNKCYIGQSVDIYKRWCDHCKCGCGMDTPKNNKLYAAMLEDGLENFTFELLEECSREELNKKELFYIDLYESNDYGYNITQGNN